MVKRIGSHVASSLTAHTENWARYPSWLVQVSLFPAEFPEMQLSRTILDGEGQAFASNPSLAILLHIRTFLRVRERTHASWKTRTQGLCLGSALCTAEPNNSLQLVAWSSGFFEFLVCFLSAAKKVLTKKRILKLKESPYRSLQLCHSLKQEMHIVTAPGQSPHAWWLAHCRNWQLQSIERFSWSKHWASTRNSHENDENEENDAEARTVMIKFLCSHGKKPLSTAQLQDGPWL